MLARAPHGITTDLPDIFVYLEIGAGLAIALFCPNTSQIMTHFHPGTNLYQAPARSRLVWRLTPTFAGVAALMFFVSLALVGQPAKFIYFNF